MERSTFKVLFYVNGSKEKNGIVLIVTGERRKTKKEQIGGKRKYRKKTNFVRLCADNRFNRQTLIAYHDNYARVMAKYGLQRGVRGGSTAHYHHAILSGLEKEK